MTNILILGAHGQIAHVATDLFLKRTDARLTLYMRYAQRLKLPEALSPTIFYPVANLLLFSEQPHDLWIGEIFAGHNRHTRVNQTRAGLSLVV
jgi:hypothetical protein